MQDELCNDKIAFLLYLMQCRIPLTISYLTGNLMYHQWWSPSNFPSIFSLIPNQEIVCRCTPQVSFCTMQKVALKFTNSDWLHQAYFPIQSCFNFNLTLVKTYFQKIELQISFYELLHLQIVYYFLKITVYSLKGTRGPSNSN